MAKRYIVLLTVSFLIFGSLLGFGLAAWGTYSIADTAKNRILELHALSAATGFSVQSIVAYEAIAEKTGMSLDELHSMLEITAKRMKEAGLAR